MSFFIFNHEVMPNVTLPDGSVKSYDQSLTVAEVASSIGSGLAKGSNSWRD
jgi:threonyl-tRNA synthetase